MKKSYKNEKNEIHLRNKDYHHHDQSKNNDISEALKQITNLPKSKEPFETLSSLCNDPVNLKTKKRSNLKKRTKEEKSINLAKGKMFAFAS